MNSPTPVALQQRIVALDILRGVALLGILLMNIQGFAMVEAAYFNPSAQMNLAGLNWWVWALCHVFADLKFMAIFSMLFGAGIIVLTGSKEAAGQPFKALHFKRTFWLLAFGLAHAYLIWFGDILVTYAICALAVFWFRNWSPRALLIIAALVLLVAPVLTLLGGLSLQYAPSHVSEEVIGQLVPSAERVAEEVVAYRGGWSQNLSARIQTVIGMHTEAIPFFLFWRASGLMLLGMALYKLGILSASRGSEYYQWMIFCGLLIGLPLALLSVIKNSTANWDPYYSFFGAGSLYNYFGSVGMAVAYIGIVMRLVQADVLQNLKVRFAAVGRMAFTNYIMQSVICTFIFYGFGLGLFASVERWGQLLIVFLVWLLQLVVSPVWLRYFRFGPLEWLWRSLTYGRLQPFRA